MTEQELIEQRRTKWRVNGNPIRTLEEAQEFIDEIGLCLLYPVRPPKLLPTFFGATVGSDADLPLHQQAFSDPRTEQAIQLMIRLLRNRFAFESNTFGETPLLFSASVFPYFYATITDYNPKQPPKKRGRQNPSPLAVDTFRLLQRRGAMNKQQLRAELGGDLSEAGIDHALHELWSALKITRVDYSPQTGAVWDALYRWDPKLVDEGCHISVGEALSALLSRYVDALIAADQNDIDEFFSAIAPRSRIRETVNALLSAREFRTVSVDGRMLIGTAHSHDKNLSAQGVPRASWPRQRNSPAVAGAGKDRRKG
jgi:23S rRNA pseudouridine2605 synthase